MSKQVTPEQLQVWLADPVTNAYLDCMQYCLEQSREQLADGKGVVPASSDLTLYNQAILGSRRDTLIEALDPQKFLGDYEKPEVANA